MKTITLCVKLSIKEFFSSNLVLKTPKLLSGNLFYKNPKLNLKGNLLKYKFIKGNNLELHFNKTKFYGNLNLIKSKHNNKEHTCSKEYLERLMTLLKLNPEYRTYDVRILYDKRDIYLPDLIVSPLSVDVNIQNIGDINYIEETTFTYNYINQIQETLKHQKEISLDVLKSTIYSTSLLGKKKEWLICLVRFNNIPVSYIFNNFWYDSSSFEDMIIVDRFYYLKMIDFIIKLLKEHSIPHCFISKVTRDVDIKQCNEKSDQVFNCEGIDEFKNLDYFEKIIYKYLQRCP